MERIGRHLFLVPEPAQSLFVDEQDAVEQAVLPHEILGSADLFLRLVLLVTFGLIVAEDLAGRKAERAHAKSSGRRQEASSVVSHDVAP